MNEMMRKIVTKRYKKRNTNKSNWLNFKAKQNAIKLKIQKLDRNEAHVTIKDHKGG